MGFSAAGAVSLTDASITGELNLEKARLTGLDIKSRTLIANRMTVTGDLLLVAFTSVGDIDLAAAQLSGELRWFPGEVSGWKLDLTGAFANRLADDGNWPKDGRLAIAGFTYNGFSGDPEITWRERRDWIRGQYPPLTEPVAEEQPGQPLPAAAARLSRFATQPCNLIIPSGNISDLQSAPTAQKCESGYPCFYPAGFALDTVVPLINVHQADNWAINGDVAWGWAWEGGLWVATGLGWAFATLFVAGYTGIVRTD